MADDCSQNLDPLRLVREGTSQPDRAILALDPAQAPVEARPLRYGVVFAQSYARLLNYFDATDTVTGDWGPLFSGDPAVPLAVAAIEDVESYKSTLRSWFDFLNDLQNQSKTAKLRDRLGYLYAAIGGLADGLDDLKQRLPPEVALKGVLANLIVTQLAPAFRRLVAYYRAGDALGLINPVAPAPPMQILRRPVGAFADVLSAGLSTDWTGGADWAAYIGAVTPDNSVYGPAATVFVQINHCSTHNLFRSVFDQFLKVLVRAVAEADQDLDNVVSGWDKHEPHYALFLAFLQLFEHVRDSANTLTQRHLDFYYRTILGLKEKPARPGHAHLYVQLARQAASRDFAPGELFKAGKDSQGKDAVFSELNDMVANQALVASQSSLYRHGTEPVPGAQDQGRLFASPVANSDDGLGAPLTSIDQSWEPFYNKVYKDGALSQISMPEADVGFAVASHYLLLAEGTRYVWLVLEVSGYAGAVDVDFKDDFRFFLTTDKGWLEKQALAFLAVAPGLLILLIELTGADASVTPYSAKAHGYTFQTDLPMLLIKLKQDVSRPYAYAAFETVTVSGLVLFPTVSGLKTLAVSNDFGPVDTSKPFQPFGASPVAGSALVIGSKEIFQKTLWGASISLPWQIAPAVYPSGAAVPGVNVEFLSAGQWATTSIAAAVSDQTFYLTSDLNKPVLDAPDFTGNEAYATTSRQGFLRLKLSSGFGQGEYQADLLAYLADTANPKKTTNPGSTPPTGPTAAALSMDYSAVSTLDLSSAKSDAYQNRPGQFFHLAPFGTAERHPYLSAGAPVPLLPQFSFQRDNVTQPSEAEYYIGVSGLQPPQTLSLLFHVVDGTANPLAAKPKPHIDWSYLKDNAWTPFDQSEVQDGTGELLDSGIVALAVPLDATSDNTLMPSGFHWVRAAVHERSDAVCRLQLVAAQGLEVEFNDNGNAPDFSATPLPAGTISKLVTPDAAVKSVTQPYPSFGGRGAELAQDFYARISERLRHKDRAIELWDYEHLILEAFPQVYKVKCLNHTCFEPNDTGTGVYRELAPGHVTVVAIPDLKAQQQRDPLKPYTSLGVLQDIQAFLAQRVSCFATLHVKNPQFEEVRVRFALRLYDGYDETYYTQQLKQAITRFLSPWAFAAAGAPSFGGKIYKSVLIDFVEGQPYVDYVTDFQVFQDVSGVAGTVDLDEVTASLAVSVLVSAPAGKHDITILHPAQDSGLAEICGCDA
jgi:hypothetical protein